MTVTVVAAFAALHLLSLVVLAHVHVLTSLTAHAVIHALDLVVAWASATLVVRLLLRLLIELLLLLLLVSAAAFHVRRTFAGSVLIHLLIATLVHTMLLLHTLVVVGIEALHTTVVAFHVSATAFTATASDATSESSRRITFVRVIVLLMRDIVAATVLIHAAIAFTSDTTSPFHHMHLSLIHILRKRTSPNRVRILSQLNASTHVLLTSAATGVVLVIAGRGLRMRTLPAFVVGSCVTLNLMSTLFSGIHILVHHIHTLFASFTALTWASGTRT